MMNKDTDRKRMLVSIGSTVAFHGLVLAMLLLMGLRYPDPPPAELGVEMAEESLSDIGLDTEHAAEGGEDVSNQSTVSDESDETVTQDVEDVPLASRENKRPVNKNKPKKNNVKQNEQTQNIDHNDPWQKVKEKKGGGSNQGTGNGDGKGAGGDGKGSGVSFNLGGRGSKALAKPTSSTSEVGTIVVEIFVNQEGVVKRANGGVRGTTISDKNMWKKCEQAARKSKFAADPDAPEEQRGTITYKFI